MRLTSSLFLHSHLMPIHCHPIPQGHPQLCLLLRGHLVPPLLDVRQCRVRHRVLMPRLLLRVAGVAIGVSSGAAAIAVGDEGAASGRRGAELFPTYVEEAMLVGKMGGAVARGEDGAEGNWSEDCRCHCARSWKEWR